MRLHPGNIAWCACWIAAVAILAGTAAAGAQGRLAMRYACAVEGGRVLVEPSSERSYAIVGRHEQEAFTACSRPNARHCRTWMLHRFELECDGGRVPWHAVVAAAPPVRGWNMWAENGRLHLRRAHSRVDARRRPCFGLPWRGPGERFEGFADWSDCEPYRPRRNAVHVLPAGFAPLVHLGARIVSVPPPLRPDETVQPIASVPVPRLVSGPNEQQQPASPPEREQHQSASPSAAATPAKGAAPVPRVLQLPPKQVRPAPDAPARSLPASHTTTEPHHAAGAAWRTSTNVEPASSGDERAGADRSGARLSRSSATAAIAVAILLAFAWRRLRFRSRANPAGIRVQETYQPDLGPVRAEAPTRTAVEDLMHNADDFHVHVVALAGRMRDNDALRDVVADELASIQSSLRAPDLARAYAAEDWGKLRQCAVQVLTDLERIRRIVQSANEAAAAAAVAPRPPARPGHAMPTTREEALAALGVNAEASEKVIKKIVDAMRQTWHPDLARNDIDRRTREERMKQINIAWDMLRTRRQAA